MNDVIAKIKAILASEDPIAAADESTIQAGDLAATSGATVPYRILLGLNYALANRCDDTWGVFNVQLMQYIQEQGYGEKELAATLSKVQVDDGHWRWLDKSLLHSDGHYKWFFLIAEGEPQAACLIYHPKPSAIDGQGIFYIEYLATAPWNRPNPMTHQTFKGAATLLVEAACRYAMKDLGLRPGFSLHSLPKAAGYYLSIGMQPFAAFDKSGLPYFEMPHNGPMLMRLAA